MIRPVLVLHNYWVAVGVMASFCQGGGVGLTMAQWMIYGKPSIEVWAMDVAQFGEFATPEWGAVKSSENYERRFVLSFPKEKLPMGRLQKTTALMSIRLEKGRGAWGLEFLTDGEGEEERTVPPNGPTIVSL